MYFSDETLIKYRLAEQDQLEGDFGGEEMGNEEMVESENIQCVLGDQIPSDVIDPTQDPNIMVGEVCFDFSNLNCNV